MARGSPHPFVRNFLLTSSCPERETERERENRVRDAPERLENIDENRGIPSINVFAPYSPPPQFQIPLRRTIGSRQKYIQILCTSDNWSSIYPSVIPCFSRISYNYDVESVKDILRKNSNVACFTIFRNFLKIPFFCSLLVENHADFSNFFW